MTDEQNREQLDKEEEQRSKDLQKLREEIESGIKGLKEGKYMISDDMETLLTFIEGPYALSSSITRCKPRK